MSVVIGVSHCGAGCNARRHRRRPVRSRPGLAATRTALPAEYIADFTLAFTLGIVFQYFAIAPMRDLGLREGLVAALKADTLSLTAFEIGLFGWMAIMQLVLFTHPHLTPDHTAYWLLMQIGMILGFATAYPCQRTPATPWTAHPARPDPTAPSVRAHQRRRRRWNQRRRRLLHPRHALTF